MKFGIHIGISQSYSDPKLISEIAYEAEISGWDGFFVTDSLYGSHEPVPVCDPWVALSAIAVKTKKIKIGPMICAIPRRRPWKLARETVSLDILSEGRLILGVGLGSPAKEDFERFGEEPNNRKRANKLDESLEILIGLWSGKPFSYNGDIFKIQESIFLPKPIQTPRIPIWVAGEWPNKRPFRRAAIWDGVYPIYDAGNHEPGLTPEILDTIVKDIKSRRVSDGDFDVVVEGKTPNNDKIKSTGIIDAYHAVGATWWLEWIFPGRGTLEQNLDRIKEGPPILK